MSTPEKELALSFQDIYNLVPEEARWAAVLAAEAVLQERGVTLEECVRVGANSYPEYQVGEVPSFFDPANRIGSAWLAAVDAAIDAISTPADIEPNWQLRIIEKPVQLPN